jgi:hypothetical protein
VGFQHEAPQGLDELTLDGQGAVSLAATVTIGELTTLLEEKPMEPHDTTASEVLLAPEILRKNSPIELTGAPKLETTPVNESMATILTVSNQS